MAFDFKKECKELYKPASKPSIVTVPPMSYVAVRGKGDPNTEGGEYQNALPLLYGIAYTVKMSKKGSRSIKGYFDFVVPPLEGFWWQDSPSGDIDYVARTISTLSRAFACPISSPEMTLTGQSRKPRPKRNLTFLPSSCLKLTRASAFNACTPGPTTTNRRP